MLTYTVAHIPFTDYAAAEAMHLVCGLPIVVSFVVSL